jgi:glycosyltransferase involved in cell wall biosynthesis
MRPDRTRATPPHLLVVAPSAELYGSDRALLAALPALVEVFTVTVAVPAPGPAVQRAQAAGADVVVLPDYALRRRHLQPREVGPWLARCAVAVARLHRRHRRRPVDLVYSNTLAAGIGPVLRLLWSCPHVLHVHECPRDPSWLPRALLRLARATASRVVCNSEYSRSFVLSHEPRLADRTVVVHNGLDLPDAETGPPADGPLRIACVARVHPKKGHGVLFEAAHLAAGSDSRWAIHLYGDALPEHAALREALDEQVARLGLTDTVDWHGFVEDVGQLYRGADVAVVPSVVPEEFSLVALEAQGLGLPVVATGPGGPSEVVVHEETGFVVPPGDAPALAAALRRLELDPTLRREMGRRGRDRARSVFSRSAYAARIREVCEQAVGIPPSG